LAVADGKVFGITAGIFDWNSFEFTQLPTVFALDAFTGGLLWDFEFRGSGGFEIGSPAYHDGKVFATLSNKVVIALDAGDGGKVWETEVDEEGLSSSPTVAGNLVLTGTGSGKVVALHAGNGSVAWEAKVGGWVYLAQPTVHEGTVYIGTDNGTFHALSLENGSEVWTYEDEGRFRGTALVHEGSIFLIRGVYDGFIAKEGYLLALDMDGRMLWERDIGTTGSSPAVVGSTVVVGSSGGLRAITTSGELMWRFKDWGPVTSSPVIAGGRIYFVTNVNDSDSGLHTSVFSLAPDGSEDWRKELEPRNWALSSVAIADGRIYVATDAGWVYSLGDTSFNANFEWTADGGNVDLNDTSVSVGANVVTRTWKVPGMEDAGDRNISVRFTASGDYPVELVVTDEFGRTANVTKVVTVTLPDLVAGFTYVADGRKVTFTANATPQGLAIESYEWTIEGLPTPLNGQTVTHEFEEGGEVEVTLTVTDEYEREASDTQTVEVKKESTGDGGMFDNPTVLYGLVGFVVVIVLVGLAIAVRGRKE
jgi:outer membrane protein assembly factor BamB